MHRLFKNRATAKASLMDKSSSSRHVDTSSRLEGPLPVTRVPPSAHDTPGKTAGEPLIQDFQLQYSSPRKDRVRERAPQSIRIEKPVYVEDLDTDVFSQHSLSEEAPPPPDFSRKPLHRPVSSSSSSIRTAHRVRGLPSQAGTSSMPTTPDSREGSSFDSAFSAETTASSISTLPPLQTKGFSDEAGSRLDPLLEEDDPQNFDLVAAPAEQTTGVYGLEVRAEHMFSSAHLEMIFADSKQLLKFTNFLNNYRVQSIPVLIYYLDALKAMRAISYANAISEALEPIRGHGFTEQAPQSTQNLALQEKAERAFEVLVREDLPAYIVHVWIQVVSVSIQRRVTGTLAPHLREASEGLAEVFCLSDPSRPDNPIVFASEEFHRTTQYGINYAIGRNCRFLQGPRTNPNSVRRLAEACKNAKEHSEVFVNYRRDGSPFMNLLMVAPLFDSKGTLRYYVGAQVDVSGLAKDCTDLDALAKVVARDEDPKFAAEDDAENQKDEFQSLSEMFNVAELDTVRNHGGRMHRQIVDESDRESIASHRPRLLLHDPITDNSFDQSNGTSIRDSASLPAGLNGRLEGVYQHYLLVRPAPSLRILFTSPSLRVPGILQSPFLSRIGGSSRVRADLSQALSEGRGVTAKVRWLTKIDSDGDGEGRARWIHATPLYGHTGSVGVWMVLLVDDHDSIGSSEARRRFRPAPPVASTIAGRDFDGRAPAREKNRDSNKMDRFLPPQQQQFSLEGPEWPMSPDSLGGWQAESSSTAQRLRGSGGGGPPPHVVHLDKRRTPSINSGRGTAASELSFQLK